MRWLAYLPLVVVLLGGYVFARHQRRTGEALEREIRECRDEFVKAATSPEIAGGSDGAPPNAQELERLRAARTELLRLRGMMSELRQAADAKTDEEIQAAVASEQRKAAEARKSAALLKARIESEDRARAVVQSLSQSMHLVKHLISMHPEVPVRSWSSVAQALTADWGPAAEAQRGWFGETWKALNQSAIRPEAFEILPIPPTYDPRDPESGQNILLLRERTPRALPDGGWTRAYAFLNGEITEAKIEGASFDAWEREAILERTLAPR